MAKTGEHAFKHRLAHSRIHGLKLCSLMPLKCTGLLYPKSVIEMAHMNYVHGHKIDKDEPADGILGVSINDGMIIFEKH